MTLWRKTSTFLPALLMALTFSIAGWAQESTDDSKMIHFNGNVSVTNNGFSLIPTFSLGKPALITDVSLGGDKFSFDPQFRFDLAGLKPWSFVFIWRYKFVDSDRFLFRLGLHMPVIVFREETFVTNGSTKDRLIPKRFVTPEITATYRLAKHLGIGLYYLYSLGLEKEDQTKHSHFISLRAYFTELSLSKQLYLKFIPQLYYLILDGTSGIYAAQNLELVHRKFPLSVSTMMNFKIDSELNTDRFDWNLSLIYTFKNEYTRKRRQAP